MSETNKPQGRTEIPPGERPTGREYISKTWALDAWLYWMVPERREWLWYRADLDGENAVVFVIDQIGDPPAGAPPDFLRLFRATGAVDYDELRLPDYVR